MTTDSLDIVEIGIFHKVTRLANHIQLRKAEMLSLVFLAPIFFSIVLKTVAEYI